MVLLDENRNSLTVVKDSYQTARPMVFLSSVGKEGKHNKGQLSETPDFFFKFILLGDASVGKTSLAKSFRIHTYVCTDTLTEKRRSSTEHMDSIIQWSGNTIFTRLYDTAGKYILIFLFE